MAAGVGCVVAAVIAALANDADDGLGGAVGGPTATDIDGMHPRRASAAISADGEQWGVLPATVGWVDDDDGAISMAWLDGAGGGERGQRYGCGGSTVPTMVCTTICPGGV